MPKLRNGSTDVEMLTQWLGRKCKNHHPLEELKLTGSARAAMPNMHTRKGEANVVTLADDGSVLLYTAAGRTFEVIVREVDEDTYSTRKKVAVGH